jgi:hypothetical protein
LLYAKSRISLKLLGQCTWKSGDKKKDISIPTIAVGNWSISDRNWKPLWKYLS